MDYQQQIDNYLMINQKYFPPEKIVYMKEKLLTMDPQKFSLITSVDLKDPTVLIIISVFLGSLGIDRFMLGDVGMGVLKLLTFGVCGILTIIDWCTIMNRTRELNFNNLMLMI